jgi:hypothetical protein
VRGLHGASGGVGPLVAPETVPGSTMPCWGLEAMLERASVGCCFTTAFTAAVVAAVIFMIIICYNIF